jgi:phage-related protein
VNESLDTLGKHIGNASNQYVNVNKSFTGMGQKLTSARSLSGKIKKELQEKLIDEDE